MKSYFILSIILVASIATPPIKVGALTKNCPEVKVLFARGSGAERWNNSDYLEFKARLQEKFDTIHLDYDFIDLDYPAQAVGIDNLGVALGTFFSGGEANEFGESVDAGVYNLTKIVNDLRCSETKYVIGGYSQGAMVALKSLHYVDSKKIIYVATFGDPKIYLPEGYGLFPSACRGENLSRYRIYVPDCYAYGGLLGSYIPYETEAYIGKIGTWCNKHDIMCSAHTNFEDHTGYVSAGLYEDASRVIFDRVLATFYRSNPITYPHDVAFLIDSTDSMEEFFKKAKPKILKMAEEILDLGSRVSLFDYRDLNDPYTPKAHCLLNDCTKDIFKSALDGLTLFGGGDIPESTLSAAIYAMQHSGWQEGFVKSLVIVTDALFLSPDRDNTTISDVVKLSQSIDPVNIYFITTTDGVDSDVYELSQRTDGLVITDFADIDSLLDHIMKRFDSLPRVEEEDSGIELPTIGIESTEWVTNNSIRIRFNYTGTKIMVVLNDSILGATEDNEIIVSDIDRIKDNTLLLVPLSNERRGLGVSVEFHTLSNMNDQKPAPDDENYVDNNANQDINGDMQYIDATKRTRDESFVPKTPNTGKK